ncbi:PAS domain S-box protein [Sulfurimonas lithotrophica]|uniref:PAS domain S-box protein n=1 Tax=Sulfurimonas lithotrophica TaxID=2590022 RepID=A0A5P8P240_9BACT|nr:PAS domain-containing protein [Sulfurimonas lithotrophica]QFR49640.1 PAS domain S-box protein [Sulfurimonas lithotrophica]
MQEKDLIYNFVYDLGNPVLLVEDKEESYDISFANEKMKELLKNTDSEDLVLTNELIHLLNSYKEKAHPHGLSTQNIEIFQKFYNINYLQNANSILMSFIETDVESLFETLSFHEMGISSCAIIVVLSDQGKVIDTNEHFLKMVGMTKEEVHNIDFFENFIPAEIETLNKYLSELLSSDSKNQQFVTSLKDVEDNIYKIKWQVSKIKKLNQNFLVAIGSDISQLFQQNNKQITKEVKSLKVGFDYFPFAVAYMNAKGIFTTMNKNFLKMFHIKNETTKIMFDQIPFFKKHIGFSKIKEYIPSQKELTYNIEHGINGKNVILKVYIRMLKGKKESSALYIIIVQKIL